MNKQQQEAYDLIRSLILRDWAFDIREAECVLPGTDGVLLVIHCDSGLPKPLTVDEGAVWDKWTEILSDRMRIEAKNDVTLEVFVD
tara:strand:- start:23020 stop:23277 length:258 start_codon:yes stop_codon:yes gene_type:complete